VKDFVESETFTIIKQELRKKNSMVLHLHGLPGSGKSATVRKLAAEFPFDNDKQFFINYLVECSDSSEDMEDCLNQLLREMMDCGLVHNKTACDRASELLKKKRSQSFVEILSEASIPTLIVIEDPHEKDMDLLNDLIFTINYKTFSSQMYFCVTSQSKGTCDFPDFDAFKKFEITGLTGEEGLKLLGISIEASDADRKAALTIISNLGGSPLGLIAVRATCKKSRLTFEEYSRLGPYSLHKEIQHLKELHGVHTKHLYQALVTLLHEKGLWDTIEILSFFHHGCIPQRLIGNAKLRQRRISRQCNYDTFLMNKQESGELISRLEDFAIGHVTGESYSDTVITLHQVAFMAVQAHIHDKESALREAVFCLASLVHKDSRTHFDHKFMSSMIPHMLSIFQFVDMHPEVLNDFIVSMAVVHLREVYGNFAKKANSEAGEQSLLRSTREIWQEISKIVEIRITFDVLINKQPESLDRLAITVAEACLTAGEKLQKKAHLLDEYISLVMRFKSSEVNHLCKISTNETVTDWLQLASKYSLQIAPDQLREFRALDQEELFLDLKTHCRVFYFDRLVSVLYSLGKVILHDSNVTREKRERFVWISDMSHALCELCRQQTGVSLLFLPLSAVSRVNVRLKRFSVVGDKVKKTVLEDVRNVVENNLNATQRNKNIVYYENGLRKTVESEAFVEITNLISMVRIHLKMMKMSCSGKERNSLKQSGDEYYTQLLTKAQEHMQKWIMCSECLIYCGKYAAAVGSYEKAVQHFQEALSGKAVADERDELFPKACYCYAKATVAGKMNKNKQEALEKCHEALRREDDINNKNLVDKLKDQTDHLIHM